MSKAEMEAFIEEMETINDTWTLKQVEDVYGEYSLEDALADRKRNLGMHFTNLTSLL